MQEGAPVLAEYLPASQSAHCDSAVAPSDEEYFPVPHALQPDSAVKPMESPYFPAGQLLHPEPPKAVGLPYLPVAHLL